MVTDLYSRLLKPLLFSLDAERAHDLAVRALETGLLPSYRAKTDPRLAVRLFDLSFPNPVGLAAGFDKNGRVPDGLLAQGFGFVEIGTVTPRPQPGNPKPRLFRLPGDHGIINRFGFNNDGHDAVHGRLMARRRRGGVVGVNIGANKDADDRVADYVAGIAAFADVASYFTVNVSSPNTPGLRDLQAKAALDDLLYRVLAEREASADKVGRRAPVFLKIAPDLDEAGFDDIVQSVLETRVDGVIVSNTTLARDGLSDPKARETGGLSGRPLFAASTRLLARMRKAVGLELPLIGVGGIESGETAFAKIAAGANLVQLYTGYVYEGLDLVPRVLSFLSDEIDRRGLATIADATGIDVDRWVTGEAAWPCS